MPWYAEWTCKASHAVPSAEMSRCKNHAGLPTALQFRQQTTQRQAELNMHWMKLHNSHLDQSVFVLAHQPSGVSIAPLAHPAEDIPLDVGPRGTARRALAPPSRCSPDTGTSTSRAASVENTPSVPPRSSWYNSDSGRLRLFFVRAATRTDAPAVLPVASVSPSSAARPRSDSVNVRPRWETAPPPVAPMPPSAALSCDSSVSKAEPVASRHPVPFGTENAPPAP